MSEYPEYGVPDFFIRGVSEGGISGTMHEWTKQHPQGYHSLPPAAADPDAKREFSWQRWNTADIQLTPNRDLQSVADTSHMMTLHNRRSIRHYAREPYTKQHLADFLSLSLPPTDPPDATPYQGIRRWNRQISLNRVVLLALDIEGIEPGAYLYHADDATLSCIRQESPQQLINRTFFQAEFTHAPLMLMVAGSLSETIARYGDRGYRYLSMEAGVLLQRFYFAAASLEMSGSISGSFTPEDFHQWLDFDGYNQVILSSFVTGHRPQEGDDIRGS